MTESVLAVAAHSDDEVLACGGTIARFMSKGDHFQAVFLADGVGSRLEGDLDQLQRRNQARDEALQILGFRVVTL